MIASGRRFGQDGRTTIQPGGIMDDELRELVSAMSAAEAEELASRLEVIAREVRAAVTDKRQREPRAWPKHLPPRPDWERH